jgi:acylphosphatase
VGIVQGVGFRVGARRTATELGLAGIARNDPDGSVAIEVEGDPEAIQRFIDWCETGPPSARVVRVEIGDRQPPFGWRGFTAE